MWWRAVIAGLIVAGVSELSNRNPRLGALLLSLPIISIIAFIAVWTKEQNIETTARLARETLILVPLGLPFFVPLAFSQRIGLGFWSAFALGILLASVTISLWLVFGEESTK